MEKVADNICELHTSANPWRSHILQPPCFSTTEKPMQFRVRSIMNRLLPFNLNSMLDEMMALEIDTPVKQRLIAANIVDTALDMPKFSDVIAQIIERLECLLKYSKFKSMNETTTPQTDFMEEIMKIVKQKFEQTIARIKDVHAEEINSQPLREVQIIKHFRACALMTFIGALFNHSLIMPSLVTTFIDKLLDSYDSQKLEFLCQLLKTLGEKFEQTPVNNKIITNLYSLEDTIEQLKDIIAIKSVEPRLRFMLQDVIDLRQNHWEHIKKYELITIAYKKKPKTVQKRKEKQEKSKQKKQKCDLENLNNPYELHQTSNPWRASAKTIEAKHSDVNNEGIVLLRKVNGLLNRLVPENFEFILNEIMKLQIDTRQKQFNVAILILKAAIKTPKYIDVLIKLVDSIQDNFNKSFSKNDPFFMVMFLCEVDSKFESIESVMLYESKSSLQELDELKFNTRLRNCAIVNMIGEIFVQSFLDVKSIQIYFDKLIDINSEESLECVYYLISKLCKHFNFGTTESHSEDEIIGCTMCVLFEKIKKVLKNDKQNGSEKKLSTRLHCLFENIFYRRSCNWKNIAIVEPKIQNVCSRNIPEAIHSSLFFLD